MKRRVKNGNNHRVQFLFTMLLFLSLALCSALVISFGARVYENVSQRMEENFSGSVAVSYVANKVRQMDERAGIRVYREGEISVLCLEQQVGGKQYQTLIYGLDGSIRELFCESGADLTLEDGIPILESEGIRFDLTDAGLLTVETLGAHGDTILLAVRSEGGRR